jgi:hypothetical protein
LGKSTSDLSSSIPVIVVDLDIIDILEVDVDVLDVDVAATLADELGRGIDRLRGGLLAVFLDELERDFGMYDRLLLLAFVCGCASIPATLSFCSLSLVRLGLLSAWLSSLLSSLSCMLL